MRSLLLTITILINLACSENNPKVYFFLNPNSCINCTIAADKVLKALLQNDSLLRHAEYHFLYPYNAKAPAQFLAIKNLSNSSNVKCYSDEQLIERLMRKHDISNSQEFLIVKHHDKLLLKWQYGELLRVKELTEALNKITTQ